LRVLLCGRLDISTFVDRVELPALNRVQEDFGGFLDAFEEGVVVHTASCSFLIGMVTENLLTVGTLDLLLSGLVAILGETENCVVILVLFVALEMWSI
jgi:hypothetical protein